MLDALRTSLHTLLAGATSADSVKKAIGAASLDTSTSEAILAGDIEVLGLILEEGVPSRPNDLNVAIVGGREGAGTFDGVNPDIVALLLECGHVNHYIFVQRARFALDVSSDRETKGKYERILDLLQKSQPKHGDINFAPIRPAKGSVERARRRARE